MDFDSCFGECRRASNSTSLQCQRFKPPMEIQGQGDCNCNADFQGSSNFWPNSDKRKKFKSKFREDSNPEPKPEGEKKFPDPHLAYFGKRDWKFRQENKEPDNYDSMSCAWDSPYSSWMTNVDPAAPQEPIKRPQYQHSDDITEKFMEFEHKVDFLFRLFKDFGQKFPSEGHGYIPLTKAAEGVPGDVMQLFDLSNRMSIVEEGVSKLATILEDLLKDPKKGKTPLFPEESLLFSDPLNFDEMNMTQRMNYLKSKNDLLKSLIKAFFNAGSVDDICSRMSSLSKDYDFKQNPLNFNVDFEEKQQKALNVDEIVNSLKKIKKQMDVQPKKFSDYEQTAIKTEKKEEYPIKFYPENRLEVISEQAELAFSEDTEPETDDFEEKTLGDDFKDDLSEIKEKSQDSNFSIHDVTSRLSAQEAELLNSSLKKVQFELFSSLDSTGKKFFKTNMKDIRITGKEEVKRQIQMDESDTRMYDEAENHNTVNPTPAAGKCLKHEEPVEAPKPARNSPERSTTNLLKQTETEEVKKPAEQSECKTKLTRRIPQKNNFTMLPCYLKGRRSDSFGGEYRSPTREDVRKEAKEERQRPATEPRTARKALSPLGLKPPVPERQKKNSGINNVKNKNKILLSKKSFVQTP